MEALLTLTAVVLGPVAVTSGVLRLLRWASRSGPPGPATRRAGQPADLQHRVADLGRLERRYREVERSVGPGRAERLRAVALAYDEALRDCCLALGLPGPGLPPLGAVARLEAEALLAQHGLSW